jgi:tRNA-binding EMAP/Myf-like protein
MEKRKIDGVDYVLLSEAEYQEVLSSKKYPTLNRSVVNIQIPFKDNNVSNWNEPFNADSHCGVIYKENKITLGELRLMLIIAINEHPDLNKLTKCSVVFDGSPLNVMELTSLITKFDSFKTINYRQELAFDRELRISV